MARGGAREGAGRPKGSVHARTQEAANRFANDGGPVPLEVLVLAMRKALMVDDGSEPSPEQWKTAAGYAEKAAPYMHHKLAAVTHTGKDGEDLIPEQEYSDRDLARAIVAILSGAKVAGGDGDS